MLSKLCAVAWLCKAVFKVQPALGHDECEESYECQGDFHEDEEDNIECNGYYSCTEANLGVIGDNFIQCAGSSSCFDAELKSLGTMVCDGMRSCETSRLISDGPVNCDGSQSCRGATINVTSADTLSCYGDAACSDATIYATNVRVQGIFGARDATITNNASGLSVYFDSYASGSGATVMCSDGATCSITCHSSGCDGVTFDCEDGATCSVDCTDSESCNLCPDGFDATYAWETIDADQLEVTQNLDEVATECLDQINDGSAWLCLNSDACQNSAEIGPATGNYPVCCSGNEACESVGLIKNEKYIMCDGRQACGQSTMQMSASSNVLCVGDESCSSAQVIGSVDVPSQRLYCGGYSACKEVNVTHIDEVYCTARLSCSGMTVEDIEDGSVYSVAVQGLNSAVLGDIGGDVYCLSEGACKKLQLESAENVYASGFLSLSEASISNVNDDVFCIGDKSCYKASLSDVEKIYAFGPSALESANIYGRSDGKLFVEIGGDNSNALDSTYGATYIHCNDTQTCIVSCRSTYACTMVTVFCNGNCDYVNCNDKDDDNDVMIACPTQLSVGNGNECKNGSDGSDDGLVVLLVILIILLLIMLFLFFQERKKNRYPSQAQVAMIADSRGAGGAVGADEHAGQMQQQQVETDPNTGKKEFATIDAE